MKQLHLAAALAAMLFGAVPASAFSVSIDLPRLDFPAPQPEASRDCQTVSTLSPTCAAPKKAPHLPRSTPTNG